MRDLPDAPWIRETERNGAPDYEDYHCPVCGIENPEWFYFDGDEVIGCECCIKRVDAYQYIIGGMNV